MEIQNYIDNTGVQVADVVIGFIHIAKKSPEEVRALAAPAEIRLFLLGLYASVTQFYEADKTRSRTARRNPKIHRRRSRPSRGMARSSLPAIVRCHFARWSAWESNTIYSPAKVKFSI